MLAAEELGYETKPATPRRSNRRGLVALLVPDITNPFYFDIIRGSRERLLDSGYLQVSVNTEGFGEEERAALESLTGVVQGAILTTSRLADEEVRAFAREMPLVTLNGSIKGIPDISIDTASVVGEAVEHLASLGHRRICYVSGPTQSVVNRRRWNSFQDTAEALGLEATRIGPFSPWQGSGAVSAAEMLASGATATVAFNDVLAIEMLQRFAELGVRVPDDVSIVGCDDIAGSEFCFPPLTTISASSRRVGRELTSLLLAAIGGTDGALVTDIDVPVHLKIRSSTGPAPRPL
jgi:DNA-binding LacI/PurR family transcriptional regulator